MQRAVCICRDWLGDRPRKVRIWGPGTSSTCETWTGRQPLRHRGRRYPSKCPPSVMTEVHAWGYQYCWAWAVGIRRSNDTGHSPCRPFLSLIPPTGVSRDSSSHAPPKQKSGPDDDKSPLSSLMTSFLSLTTMPYNPLFFFPMLGVILA